MLQLLKLAQGNPGAMMCLMGLLNGNIEDAVFGLTIIPKIEKCQIKGTDIYVLWSDLCNKDYAKMATLCENCPDDVLKDACSRQDYSGCELVAKYF